MGTSTRSAFFWLDYYFSFIGERGRQLAVRNKRNTVKILKLKLNCLSQLLFPTCWCKIKFSKTRQHLCAERCAAATRKKGKVTCKEKCIKNKIYTAKTQNYSVHTTFKGFYLKRELRGVADICQPQ